MIIIKTSTTLNKNYDLNSDGWLKMRISLYKILGSWVKS